MMKSRLYKLDGLTHKELKNNIDKVIKEIPKEKYENIIKGTYNRTEKYTKKHSNRRKTFKQKKNIKKLFIIITCKISAF